MGRKSEQSINAYNKMAAEYDRSPEGNYTRPHKAALIKKAAVKDGDAVLDVACGNGALLAALSKKAEIHTFGIDISENMIAAAKGCHPGGTFLVQPSFPLPFENDSMDIITVSCAFHHFENPTGFVGECKRVLKEKGSIYMAEPFFAPVVRWLANRVVFPFSKTGDVKVYSPGELQAFFEAADFKKVSTCVTGTVLLLSAEK